MSCARCHEPTRLRPSGLTVHADRTRDADHLPPGYDELRREAEQRRVLAESEERAAASYRAAGFDELSPLEQRYMDGDR